MNEPITIRVRKARSSVKVPDGMEISMNADGSGGAVPEKNPSPAKKKDACYSKVASRYKGGNSAYRSGAMVKCRKVGAANWGNKSK
mgnify:CR=1 FL=1